MDLTALFEVVGTIAFAFSGAFVAIECRLDMFGILCAAVVTATGGGMTRDIILGNTPPLMFRDPTYVILAAVIAFVTAVLYVPLVRWHFRKYVLGIINTLDAIGLAVFTVVSMQIAFNYGFGENAFLVCFVGVVSAVGGGVLRDIFASRQPVIMKKEVYATASLAGSIVYYFLAFRVPDALASTVSMALIFAIRMFTLYYHVNLPFARTER
ncbi:MAG: trimeric intracellular cation channel family protein [Pygmaiobacter massiliensis]|nr:trimeric intracellular cation channel family protein [Pygmaiobacter massiliensis]